MSDDNKDVTPDDDATDDTEYSELELSTLTEEERAAIDTDSDDSTDVEDDEAGEDSDSEGPSEEEDPEPEAETDKEADSDVEDNESPDDEDVSQSEVDSNEQEEEGPTEFEAKVIELETKLDDLANQYEEGEFDFREFRNKEREVLKELNAMESQVQRAEIRQELSQQAEQDAWERTTNAFLKDYPQYGNNPILQGALNTAIESVARTKEAQGKDGAWILDKAKSTVETAFGVEQEKPAPKTKSKKEKAKQPEVPKTLAHTPNAAPADTAKGEFTHLDSLDGMAYEKAISKLTPEQQDRYLA
jgi:hypothetical protein